MGLSIVLLAAGEGKRMKTEKPKPLVHLADHPLIQYSLDTAKALNPERIVLVTGHKKDEVKKYVISNNPGDFVFCEQKERLGTGHAVKQAAPYLPDNGKTLVLYADVPLVSSKTLKKLVVSANRKKLSILTSKVKDPKWYGRIIRDENQNPIAIIEEADANKREKAIDEIFTGIMVADNEFLKKGLDGLLRNNKAGEYYLTDLVDFASKRQLKIGSTQTREEEIYGANNKEELARLYRSLISLNVEIAKKKGAIFKDETTCYVEGELKVGKDVRIGSNVTIKGKVSLGNDVCVESNVLLSNTKIGANSLVKDFCSIEDSSLAKDVVVGPFARLRNGAVLDDSAKVGNFVEIKKSKIGQGSKANHHAYLGDASVGKKVNVGAGTITCNYDGKLKHKTKIDDGSFIGTNSSLVAPLKIGKKSYVAAGSVITSDVPSGSLAFGRAKQNTKKNWKKQ
jgi:bifunctional UDP-N-acetylglucosamine pyrophosphorylase/glucosamine-1-phosphate N-acetyltransferase